MPAAADTISLATLIANARARADMQTADPANAFVTDDEFTMYVNRAGAELFDLIDELNEDYRTIKLTSSGLVTGPIDTTALSTWSGLGWSPEYRMLKLRGLDVTSDTTVTSDTIWREVRSFEWRERNRVHRRGSLAGLSEALYCEIRRYKVMGDQILIEPENAPAAKFRLWVLPAWRDLSSTGNYTGLDNLQNWIEFVEISAAIKALTKEESDTSALEMHLERARQRIARSAAKRDAVQARRVVDVQGGYGGYGYGLDPDWSDRWGR